MRSPHISNSLTSCRGSACDRLQLGAAVRRQRDVAVGHDEDRVVAPRRSSRRPAPARSRRRRPRLRRRRSPAWERCGSLRSSCAGPRCSAPAPRARARGWPAGAAGCRRRRTHLPSPTITTLRISGLLSAHAQRLDAGGVHLRAQRVAVLGIAQRQDHGAALAGALEFGGHGCLSLRGARRQADRAAAAQPRAGAVARIAVDGLQVEQHFEHVGRAPAVAHRQRTERIAQAQRHGGFEVLRACRCPAGRCRRRC